ncbi:hypothetical protein [Nocardia donostiensis]|uniref:hypothetical protein n=1 Tax=Nocardia donostiensis TaxID=1538463 RepID=UPI00158AED0F|nr:hypothetical protein [Nocardia donostiensis]
MPEPHRAPGEQLPAGASTASVLEELPEIEILEQIAHGLRTLDNPDTDGVQ